MILGSYFVYCGKEATSPDGGHIRDASADACCTAPSQTFTKLAEGDLSSATTKSAAIAVGGYREVVIYSNVNSSACMDTAFRPDPGSGFGYTNSGTVGRIQVQGSDLELIFVPSDCSIAQVHYMVAGVQ